jgi:hypothetical protein
MVKLISPDLLDLDTVAIPKALLTTSSLINTLAFPLLLVVTTYTLTWLRFKVDRPVALAMTLYLSMSFLRFLQQSIFRSDTLTLGSGRIRYTDYFLHGLYEFAYDMTWVLTYYFLWEISVIQVRLDEGLLLSDQEFLILKSTTSSTKVTLLLVTLGLLKMVFGIFDSLSKSDQSGLNLGV